MSLELGLQPHSNLCRCIKVQLRVCLAHPCCKHWTLISAGCVREGNLAVCSCPVLGRAAISHLLNSTQSFWVNTVLIHSLICSLLKLVGALQWAWDLALRDPAVAAGDWSLLFNPRQLAGAGQPSLCLAGDLWTPSFTLRGQINL